MIPCEWVPVFGGEYEVFTIKDSSNVLAEAAFRGWRAKGSPDCTFIRRAIYERTNTAILALSISH